MDDPDIYPDFDSGSAIEKEILNSLFLRTRFVDSSVLYLGFVVREIEVGLAMDKEVESQERGLRGLRSSLLWRLKIVYGQKKDLLATPFEWCPDGELR